MACTVGPAKKNIIEFRSGDVASFWLLHTASTAFAGLSHLARNPGFAPERLFEKLLEVAGSLMTFSKNFTLADLPAYDHLNPGPGFNRLDQIVRDLLETVISTRYFAIALNGSCRASIRATGIGSRGAGHSSCIWGCRPPCRQPNW